MRFPPRCDRWRVLRCHLCGLFLPQRDPKSRCAHAHPTFEKQQQPQQQRPLWGAAPRALQGHSPFGFWLPHATRGPPKKLRSKTFPFATPAFARWRSACTCRVSTRTCKCQTKRSKHHEHHSQHHRQHQQRRHHQQQKPSTKQEIIAANVKLLIEQLESGHSEALTNYLTAMSRFHNYSFGNILEISPADARQPPA